MSSPQGFSHVKDDPQVSAPETCPVCPPEARSHGHSSWAQAAAAETEGRPCTAKAGGQAGSLHTGARAWPPGNVVNAVEHVPSG